MSIKAAIIFLVLGATLCLGGYYGYLATLSACSNSTTVFVTPSDTTVWLTILGLLSGITGAFGLAEAEEEKNLKNTRTYAAKGEHR